MAQTDVAPAPKSVLPVGVLVAAGLTMLDGFLATILLALWTIQPSNLLSTVQSMAGLCLLLGLAPFIVGGFLLERHSKTPGGIPGINWARWSILAGALLTAVSLLIPVMAAVSTMVAPAS